MTDRDLEEPSSIFLQIAKEHFSGGLVGGERAKMAWDALNLEQKFFLLRNGSDLDAYGWKLVIEAAERDENKFVRYLACRSTQKKSGDEKIDLILDCEDTIEVMSKHWDSSFLTLDTEHQLLLASGKSGPYLIRKAPIAEIFFSIESDDISREQKTALLSAFCASVWNEMQLLRPKLNEIDYIDAAPASDYLFSRIADFHPQFRKQLLIQMPAEGGSCSRWDQVLSQLKKEEYHLLRHRWNRFGVDELFKAWMRCDGEIFEAILREEPFGRFDSDILEDVLPELVRAATRWHPLKNFEGYSPFKMVFLSAIFLGDKENRILGSSALPVAVFSDEKIEGLSSEQQDLISVVNFSRSSIDALDGVSTRVFLGETVDVDLASRLHLSRLLSDSGKGSYDEMRCKQATSIASSIGLTVPLEPTAERVFHALNSRISEGNFSDRRERRDKIKEFYLSDYEVLPLEDTSSTVQPDKQLEKALKAYRRGFWIVLIGLILALL